MAVAKAVKKEVKVKIEVKDKKKVKKEVKVKKKASVKKEVKASFCKRPTASFGLFLQRLKHKRTFQNISQSAIIWRIMPEPEKRTFQNQAAKAMREFTAAGHKWSFKKSVSKVESRRRRRAAIKESGLPTRPVLGGFGMFREASRPEIMKQLGGKSVNPVWIAKVASMLWSEMMDEEKQKWHVQFAMARGGYFQALACLGKNGPGSKIPNILGERPDPSNSFVKNELVENEKHTGNHQKAQPTQKTQKTQPLQDPINQNLFSVKALLAKRVLDSIAEDPQDDTDVWGDILFSF